MRHGAPRQRGLDRLVDDVLDVRWTHDPLIVLGDVHVELVEIDVLLIVSADQIVERVAGDGEYRLAIALRVVQAVEEMDAARSRGREADAEASGVLGVAAGGEGSCLLVADLNEGDFLPTFSQRLEDAVDAVAGQAEDGVHAPSNEAVDQQFGDGLRHCGLLEVGSQSLSNRRAERLATARNSSVRRAATRRRARGRRCALAGPSHGS